MSILEKYESSLFIYQLKKPWYLKKSSIKYTVMSDATLHLKGSALASSQQLGSLSWPYCSMRK